METILEEIARMDAELANQVVFKTYTHGELSKAFDAVKNPKDWKAEIAAFMPGEAVMVVTAAIEFFTATQPIVKLDTRTMRYLVTSEGYRNGPAGDHWTTQGPGNRPHHIQESTMNIYIHTDSMLASEIAFAIAALVGSAYIGELRSALEARIGDDEADAAIKVAVQIIGANYF